MNAIKHGILMKRRYCRKKIQYFIMRHPIPLSSRDMRAFQTGPKVFSNGIPKAGTHLLRRVLKLLPSIAPWWSYAIDETLPGILKQLHTVRNGQVVFGHLPWSLSFANALKSEGFRILFMVRDLRDVLVSHAHYVTYTYTAHQFHRYFKSLDSDEERLMAAIVGVPEHCYPGGVLPKAWENQIEQLVPWVDDPGCLTVRFEDLVGSAGGGSDDKQIKTVASIVNHLGIELHEEVVEEIARNAYYTGSRTFRRGQIGGWKNHFTEEHKRVFKKTRGDILIKLGYESGYDW